VNKKGHPNLSSNILKVTHDTAPKKRARMEQALGPRPADLKEMNALRMSDGTYAQVNVVKTPESTGYFSVTNNISNYISHNVILVVRSDVGTKVQSEVYCDQFGR
jgi:hypothetical protein